MTMPYQTELIDQIVDAPSAPDAGVRVSISPARPIMLASEGDARWAVFSFPSIWQLRSGLLVCSVTIGEDERLSDADYHYLWFVSDDDGQHWTCAVVDNDEAERWLRERIAFSDGSQLYYEPKMVSLDALKTPPYAGHAAQQVGRPGQAYSATAISSPMTLLTTQVHTAISTLCM